MSSVNKSLHLDNAPLAEEKKYDDVPYETYVYPQTQPEHLHAIGTLFGLTPPPLEKARILELGCALGGNLIPVAMMFPQSKCVGIDISGEQIEIANQQKKDLGLKNIEFLQKDVSKIEADFGKFDYIMCHGVFSWVPEPVRDAILDVCRDHLTPNGLAVISYNVLPGWGALKTLRDMMIYHTKEIAQPGQKIREARSLLDFVHDNAQGSNNIYRQFIDTERKMLKEVNDSYIFHEHLEDENRQYYLHEFTDMAAKHGLSYVGDSSLSTMYLGNFSAQARETLSKITDAIKQEQYIDFLVNRRFRFSILTHAANTAKINRALDPKRIFDFYIRPQYEPVPQNVLNNNAGFEFTRRPTGEKIQIQDKTIARIMMRLLDIGQKGIKPDYAARVIAQEEKIDEKLVRDFFQRNGFALALQSFFALQTTPYDIADTISKKPRATGLARYQLNHPENVKITSNTKQSVNTTVFERKLLLSLDGQKDVKEIADELHPLVKNGSLTIEKDVKPVTDLSKEALTDMIEKTLKKFLRSGLLEA